MSVEELGVDLLVSTPASGLIGTSSVCVRYPIVIKGRRFKVNLISLPLQGLEVILRMDWLSTNRILVDCGGKEMLFPDKEKGISLSISVLRQDLLEDDSCFLDLSSMEATQVSDHAAQENRSVNLVVVNDFLNVFMKKFLKVD
ncbi:uncharacterized protein LOC124824314 [Vigna umbellata]|uniref:uncharacterized protein LOC124824314 n=1 Tax=Vigna umbellata TaxID=87088 RepID=UPI001F5E837C|nr:uncharacterized protein LOC124824314 [Vigna umbellata]